MRTVFSFALVACILAVVYSESCFQTVDCTTTTCAGGSFIACSHHLCTCYSHNTHGIACTDRDTCRDSGALQCDRDARHCVDGFCHCTGDQQ